MEKKWAGTTYGNNWMHVWLIRMLRIIDVRILYAFIAVFVIPVVLIVNPSCAITYRYFRTHHHYGKLRAAWSTYVNHLLFGQVVIDKFAMYAGKRFDVKTYGYEHFQALADKPEGFVQLSAHIGNYEIAGYTLVAKEKMFNALVFASEKESVMINRSKMFSGTNINMIAVKQDMSHMFTINQALADGEIVSMPADRLHGSPKAITCTFLGGEADFPLGPFSIATLRGLDVIAVNVIKTRSKEYSIFITPLNYDKEASRKQQITQLAGAYVAELEKIVKQNPLQWYNYFEFWK